MLGCTYSLFLRMCSTIDNLCFSFLLVFSTCYERYKSVLGLFLSSTSCQGRRRNKRKTKGGSDEQHFSKMVAMSCLWFFVRTHQCYRFSPTPSTQQPCS